MEIEKLIYSVNDFNALKQNSWSGAIQVLDQIEEKGVEQNALDIINDFILFSGREIPNLYTKGVDTAVSDTQLNDYIWFDLENDLKEYYNIDLWGEDNE